MYYFKDHLNFSNNLQDNLYILRQRQLKEAAWSPSSGGPAVPESAAGTNELKDRMRNIKQSGDRPQSKEYLEMDAEVKRREGRGSSGIPQSSDVKTDKVAGDWVERYARKLDMDPRKVENIRRGVIDMDTSGRGEDPISQTQDQVAQRGVEAYDKAKQYVVDMQKRDADKRKPVQPISGGSDTDIQRGQYNTNDQNSDTMDFRQEVKNFTNNFKSPAEFKTGSVNDTGADAGGYGPPSDLNVDVSANLNARDPMAFAKYLNSLRQPRFSTRPKSNIGGGGPDIDTQRGQFNINDPDSPGYNPNADMVSPRKPSTEYGTDLIDQLKQAGSDNTPDQSSLKTTLQDIIDRMKNNTLPKTPFKPRVRRRAK